MPSKKTIIFDLYGVLFFLKPSVILRQIGILNTIKFLCRYGTTPYSFYYVILDKMRLEMPGEFQDSIAYRGNLLPFSFCEWQRGALPGREAHNKIITFIDSLNQQDFFKHRDDAQLIQGFFSQAFDSKSRIPAMCVNKKLVKTIQQLKQKNAYNLVMLTNIDHELLACLQESFPEVFSLFHDVIASCEVQLIKPQPQIFEHLLQKHNLKPHEAVFFDDQEENIKAAQKVGLPAHVYRKGMSVDYYIR